jgi:hypothetical protein
MTLEESKNLVGRKVIYTPYEGCNENELETGIITGYNDKYVFVRYGSDINSKATKPEDIKL